MSHWSYEIMRKLSDWLLAGDPRRTKREARQGKTKSRRELRVEGLESREMMTANVTPVYAVTTDWNTGLQAELKLRNLDTTAVNNWTLEFDFSSRITSIWNASIKSHVGNHYVITGASWNANLPGSGAVDFGFVASKNSTYAAPTNLIINGGAIGGGGGGTTPQLPTISAGDVTIVEGNHGVTNAVFTVNLSSASTSTVTVAYATAAGTATAGSDFTAKNSVLTFAAGQTSKTVSVVVAGDAMVELDENFYLDLANATNATITKPRATATITNDDVAPAPSGNFVFHVSSDWGSGFTGSLDFKNSGANALSGWRVEFDFAGQITSIWDAKVVSHTGNHYVIENASYNGSVAAGAAMSFGFNGSRANSNVVPTNYVLTGSNSSGNNGGNTGGDNGGSTGGDTSTPMPVAGAWPAHVYAPYVDMTLYPTYNLVTAAQTQGIKYFSLAFIVADPTGQPAWGGYSEYALGSSFDANMRSQIAGVRNLGGDVVVSFGGAANRELAEVITSVADLQRAYQSVIDAYGLTHIDFDIEGAASAHHDSIDRRNQAIAGLQAAAAAAGRTLEVSYTLPVLPTGLTHDGMYVVQSAIRHGVDVSVWNVMAMDYGDSAAPNPQGRMGDYAIQAADSLFTQLKSAYGNTKTDAQLWAMVGVTPMIGLNDVTTEVFDQQEARELLAFAQQKGIGRIGMWSLNRDQQNPGGQIGWVDLKSSSVLQQPFEFSQIFNTFTG